MTIGGREMIQSEIREIREFKLIGLQCETEMGKTMERLPKLWDQFISRSSEIKNRINERTGYGISIADDPTSKKFTYIAGVEVTDDSEIPHGMISTTIRAGRYAVFKHKGPVARIGATYDAIWKEWLPVSKQKINMKAPCLERYDERFRDDDNSVMEILFPLES